MTMNGINTDVRIHRLVALAFVHMPDPEKLTVVDHDDEDKGNHNIDNLVWMNHKKTQWSLWESDAWFTKG